MTSNNRTEVINMLCRHVAISRAAVAENTRRRIAREKKAMEEAHEELMVQNERREFASFIISLTRTPKVGKPSLEFFQVEGSQAARKFFNLYVSDALELGLSSVKVREDGFTGFWLKRDFK